MYSDNYTLNFASKFLKFCLIVPRSYCGAARHLDYEAAASAKAKANSGVIERNKTMGLLSIGKAIFSI